MSEAPIDVDAKAAARIAAAYIGEMYANEHISDIRLEEIEYQPDDTSWKVTISFTLPAQRYPKEYGAIAQMLDMMKGPTLYKVVTVERGHGSVTSMKIREPRVDA